MLKSQYLDVVLFLLLFVATAAGALLYLRTVRPLDELQLVAAGVAGFFAGTLAFTLRGLVENEREARALKAASKGVLPKDGEFGAFTGTIHSDRPLYAPISGQPVVAYLYTVYRPPRGSKIKDSGKCFEGSASAPSELKTPVGHFRLLALPGFVTLSEVDLQTARHNFRIYAAQTTFLDFPLLDRDLLRREAAHRQDLRTFGDDPRSWDELTFSEATIPNGDEVTIFGWYAAGKGIGADPAGERSMSVRRTASLAQITSKQRREGLTGVIMAILIALGVILAYEHFLPMIE